MGRLTFSPAYQRPSKRFRFQLARAALPPAISMRCMSEEHGWRAPPTASRYDGLHRRRCWGVTQSWPR
jgi:hypothetical protein